MIGVSGEAREVALAEVQAVHAVATDGKYAALVGEVDAGEVDDVETLESVLELGLQSGRIRALYGPGGEQAATATLRRLPRGKERTESTAAVSAALRTLAGRTLDGVTVTAVAPGAFTLTIDAGGIVTSVRLDRNGARIVSVGT
ncbi:MAG TPA: hypothetical protein VGU02_07495 [Gaiellaceae bacterium]|nr:hypothetical protein [Gaiellaceae bacterium]